MTDVHDTAAVGAATGGAAALPQIDLLNGHLYAADPTPTYRWLRQNARCTTTTSTGSGASAATTTWSWSTDKRRYSNRNSYRPLPPRSTTTAR